MKRRARTDANHGAIKSALEACGWTVLDTFRFHDGWPDLLALKHGRVVFVEVKDGSRVPSERKLTADELDFCGLVQRAGGEYEVVTTINEAVRL